MGKDLSTEFSAIDTDYTQKGLSIKIRLRFGIVGHLTLFEVLNWINAGKGCYAECKDMTDTAVAFAITRLGSIDYAEKVEDIFRYMIEIGYFDAEAYEKEHILTSEGIVKRWAKAKKRSDPETFDLPESVREILGRVVTKNAKPVTENAESVTENAENHTENHSTSKAKYKQTNKQVSGCCPADNHDPEPVTADEPAKDIVSRSMTLDGWDETREEVKRLIFFRGIAADLVDAAASCVVNGWITLDGVRNMRRKAKDAIDLFEASHGQRGKERGWETIRDCVALVFREHGMEPPRYSRNDPEPPAGRPARPALSMT